MAKKLPQVEGIEKLLVDEEQQKSNVKDKFKKILKQHHNINSNAAVTVIEKMQGKSLDTQRSASPIVRFSSSEVAELNRNQKQIVDVVMAL